MDVLDTFTGMLITTGPVLNMLLETVECSLELRSDLQPLILPQFTEFRHGLRHTINSTTSTLLELTMMMLYGMLDLLPILVF